jgi:hypothetical protein
MPRSVSLNQQITLDFGSPVPAQGYPITIKRSAKRRTIEIIVRKGGVDLMLPRFVSTAEGMAFVHSKEDWIRHTLVQQAKLEQERDCKQYVDGELFALLGRTYPLSLYLTGKPTAQLINNKLYVGIRESQRLTKSDAVKKQVWSWYQQQALELLTDKTMRLAKHIGRECIGVKLRRTKTKWGHCTKDGEIQYNWQIILAPEPVVDYLVVHEVSHLVHHNHGKRFWRHVEKLCPDYLQHELWLKVNGYKIEL